MRKLLILLAAALLSAEAPPPELAGFQQDLQNFDFDEAARVADKIIASRTPADGKPRPDPLVNALLGRIYFGNHEPSVSGVYLDRAPTAALPQLIRSATAFDHGRTLEFRGNRSEAQAAFEEALASSQSEDQRRRSALAVARMRLPSEPAAIRSQLRPLLQGPSGSRWEAALLLALSSSLEGDIQSAQQFADLAWEDAAKAPLEDAAPMQVLTLRAGLAAAAKNEKAERAMLAASNGLSLMATPDLSGHLPVCGDSGIKPTDFVIFSYVAAPFIGLRLEPVAASRTEIVAPFTDALLGSALVKASDSYAPFGTIFTAACRTLVGLGFAEGGDNADPMLEWFVDHGLYPVSASYDADDQHLNAVSDRIDTLAKRFGKDSALLISPRWQLNNLLELRARAGDNVQPGQLIDLDTQVASGLRSAGAPEWLAAAIEARRKVQLAAGGTDDEKVSLIKGMLHDQLFGMPFPIARKSLGGLFGSMKEWPAAASELLVEVNGRAKSGLSPRERQAWLLGVAKAQRDLGRDKDARATLMSAGVSSDLCVAADEVPALLDQKFSYKDYPHDLIVSQQEGAVMFDFDITPSGTLAGHRIIYSLPSLVFDAASEKGLSTVRYTVPKRNGKAAPCRGLYQPIVWRLDDGDRDAVPNFDAAIGAPTT